jgi:uroporphyrinogen-III synthase
MQTHTPLYLWTGHDNILTDLEPFKKGVLLHAPALGIHPCEFTLPDNMVDFQSMVITSRHALESLNLSLLKNIPIWCVGGQTAKEAANAGFKFVFPGPGTAENLGKIMAETLCFTKGSVYYPRAKIVEFDMGGMLREKGFHVIERVVYRAFAMTSFPPKIQKEMETKNVQGVFFLSRQGVLAFGKMVKASGMERFFNKTTAFCLSPSVAQEAQDLGFQNVLSAKNPTRDCLLNLA